MTVNPFEPIAIIGQGCVLPGCLSPEELWQMVLTNQVNIKPAATDAWRVNLQDVVVAPGETTPLNKAWHSSAGYVEGFEALFDAHAYALDATLVAGLDPQFKWSMHAAREALRDAGYLRHEIAARSGLIMGNLSYPTRAFSQYAEAQHLHRLFPEWHDPEPPVSAFNRFMSGLPALLTAQALGLKGDAFALDAACASSLYALKLACDRLHDGSADLMLVGGVCAADQLFLHVGFTALNALSRSGMSRPFHRDADGLIPAEGAGFIVVRRLADAIRSGDRILGVVRGIGLSNDGRQGGFLSPSAKGQNAAMQKALAAAGVHPAEVSYIECHATGTSGGDATEIGSMKNAYVDAGPIHLSSLKGNIGHAITASGVAGILKVLAAFSHRTLPPTANAFPLNAQLAESNFAVSDTPLPWHGEHARIAAVSNFGFGGNNAHVIIEEWNPTREYPSAATQRSTRKVAVVGVEIQTRRHRDAREYLADLLGRRSGETRTEELAFRADRLSSPPSDLKYALGQQLLMLNTTQKLVDQGMTLDAARCGVFIGMGADAEINRYGFRKRAAELLARGGIGAENYDVTALEAAIGPIMNAAIVLGTMPNIPANRINNHFNFCGMGFTVAAEELSGLKAVDIAVDAIRTGELTCAIVGAVDLADEVVQRAALRDALGIDLPAADAAIAIALKDYDLAVADGDTVVAIIGGTETTPQTHTLDAAWLQAKVGYTHACAGMLELATAMLFTRNRLQMNDDRTGLRPIVEDVAGFSFQVACTSRFGGASQPWQTTLYAAPVESPRVRTTASSGVYCYAGNDRRQLLENLAADVRGEAESHRLGIVCAAGELPAQREQALRLLGNNPAVVGWITPRIHYRPAPVHGELAFMFTGAASAYPQMGKELLEEFPGLVAGMRPSCNHPAEACDWIYANASPLAKQPFYQLAGSSLMCQVHAVFTKAVLRLRPQAAIGLSSGETNSIFALGVWNDMDALLSDAAASDLYRSALSNEFKAVHEYWGMREDERVDWDNWRILAPLDQVQRCLADEERVYLTIVNTHNDCVIGGDKAGCARLIARLGTDKAIPLNHDLAIHCAPVQPFADAWRRLHTRVAQPVSDVRFYSHHFDGVYEPTSANVAEALTGQAVNPIDFRRIVEKAWTDGVRIFVEHGARNSLTLAVQEILRGRDFVAVALDRFGTSALTEALKAAAELWCAGVAVDLSALNAPQTDVAPVKEVRFALRLPEITVIAPATRTVESTADALQSKHRVDRAPQLAVTRRGDNLPLAVPMPESKRVPAKPRASEAHAAVHAAGTGQSANPALTLLHQQHALMREAHESYLQAQLEGQRHFDAMMRTLMQGLQPRAIATTTEAASMMAVNAASAGASHLPRQRPPAYAEISRSVDAAPTSPAPPPAVVSAAAPVATDNVIPLPLPGPKFDRRQLEILASGPISSVFGPLFAKQDGYAVQVRMPEPPLLLCDRVTGIKAEPGSLGLGTIWTETEVRADSWYLHNNRMPPGIFIEAGQADLLLISYLGIDFQNQGQRAYRLLGCELMFYGELPQPGDTLKYDIHVDGYAKSGETTLFFFHYDCHIDGKLRISVRNGQAGFFTTQELAESKGVIWDPATAGYAGAPLPEFTNATRRQAFGPTEIEAYTRGDMVTCFGPELDWTQTHTRTPRSQDGDQNFIKDVTVFDLHGGPAGRGYLRAETQVTPDDWYFAGHFKNDPCMPGTLMADACLQMMAFYMVGAGLTLRKDGWRFEPVTDEKYKFVCRGQVTPDSQHVVYEIFVDQIVLGDMPILYAHVLTTVDGTKAFLCERLGLRLVPAWPLETMQELIDADVPGKPIASYQGFRFDHRSLLACALGEPAAAFGPEFAHYDGIIRSPRLPAPPYHFMTRIADLAGTPGDYKQPSHIVAEYDIPPDAWYFAENGSANMPYAVLMEVALQPCGWLSTFMCRHDIKGKDLMFRNLDGNAFQHRAIVPGDRTIATRTSLTGVSIMGEIIILKFDVVSSIDGEPVFTMKTVFGFFDAESMKTQKGLPRSPEEERQLALPANHRVELQNFPPQYFATGTARLPASKLLMLDRIVAFEPHGGKHGRGYLRGEKDVTRDAWFFKAHFFQDPVQPGSLGVEAMLQLIQFYMLDQGLHQRFARPRFEAVALGDETEWHYRGQVTPEKQLISVDFDVAEIRSEAGSLTVSGEARLWVDGLKIYHAPKIGVRIVEG